MTWNIYDQQKFRELCDSRLYECRKPYKFCSKTSSFIVGIVSKVEAQAMVAALAFFFELQFTT